MALFAFRYSLLLLVKLLFLPERARQVEKKTCLGSCLDLFRFPLLDKLGYSGKDSVLESPL